MDRLLEKDLSGVSRTLFIPLFCRAYESLSKAPVLIDPKALEVMRSLTPLFRDSSDKLFRWLAAGKLPPQLVLSMNLRSRHFDRVTADFLHRHPEGTVLQLGCGLDTRYDRIYNGKAKWFDLDLPEVIALRKRFFSEKDSYRMIPASVTENSWISEIGGGPVLVLAEGLLMYLSAPEVDEILGRLVRAFPGGELLAEVFHRRWIRMMDSAWMRMKFEKQLHLDKGVKFTSGVESGAEFEQRIPGMEFLDEWTYFDDNEPRMGFYRWFGRFESLRKIQWTVHYRFRA